MLAGVELFEVINVVGQERLGTSERIKALKHFEVELEEWGYVVESFGKGTMASLTHKYKTLWVSVFDSVDVHFAHAALVHNGKLYDPHYGLNPTWTWSRYIGQATPVVGSYTDESVIVGAV
jgi:hypothetical protein